MSSRAQARDNRKMDAPMLLQSRPLLQLLEQTIAMRCEGLVVLRCRDGLRHGVWVQRGFVVGAHLAGEFDPLLERLRRTGALDESTHRRCLAALRDSEERAGSLALRAGVPHELLRDVLSAQLVQRAFGLFMLAEVSGHDAWFEARPVPEREVSVRLPLGSLQRRIEAARHDAARHERKQLRGLARALHPDLHAHLGPAARRELERRLAEATATYHGFVRVA